MRIHRSHIATFAAGALVATAVGAAAGPTGSKPDKFRKLDVFAEALSFIENNYVDEVDEQKLIYGAVDGMVGRLDEHSRFLNPERYRALREDTEGEYGGVGLGLTPGPDGVPVVTEVLPGGPAHKAGMRLQDRVRAIGGFATGGSAGPWRGRLRGRPGSQVVVELERVGWPEPRSISLVREQIAIPDVDVDSLEGGIGYLHIRHFQQGTDAAVRAGLTKLQRAAGGTLRGVILDLRGNPGGLYDQAVLVADIFLKEGLIVTVRGRRGLDLESERAHAARTWATVPVALLVNDESASSAEIVAGALRDNGRAVVVGTTTYGKGSVQSFIDLKDGSGLKLTTARYYTPSGESIHHKGIQPDVAVEGADAQLRAARETVLRLAKSH